MSSYHWILVRNMSKATHISANKHINWHLPERCTTQRSSEVCPLISLQVGELDENFHNGIIEILLHNDTLLGVNYSCHCDFLSVFQVCQKSQRSTAWQSQPWRATTSLWPASLKAASRPLTCAGSGTKRKSKVWPLYLFNK